MEVVNRGMASAGDRGTHVQVLLGAFILGGLSAADFVKCISVQKIGAAGLRSLSNDVERLANAEGLLAHARGVEVRR